MTEYEEWFDLPCLLCDEPIEPGGEAVSIGALNAYQAPQMRRAHRECMLRSVMGGIGHHLDHEHWCVGQHDPDGGLSYHESALAVARMVSHNQ